MQTVIKLVNRRQWLRNAALLLWGSSFLNHANSSSLSKINVTASSKTHLLSAWSADGKYWAGSLPLEPLIHAQLKSATLGIELPARAHQILPMPNAQTHLNQAIAVARRPGEYLVRFGTQKSKILAWHDMEQDRYLGGHAVFSHDGQSLYTTETDAETGQGLVAERDPITLKKRREFSTHGIGPHALLIEPNGELVVANGGILNLPETGRRKLNLNRMDASLVKLNASTGELVTQWRLEDPFLSLRHLARAPDGTLAIALQAEHPDKLIQQQAPIMALLTAAGLRIIETPLSKARHAESKPLGGYAGDIAFVAGRKNVESSSLSQQDHFLISATTAGLLTRWSLDGLRMEAQDLAEVGALAFHNTRWVATTAKGQLASSDGNDDGNATMQLQQTSLKWDNHAALCLQ